MLPVPFLHLWEFVVVEVVLRVHLDDLSLCGSPHHLNNLNKVVDAAFPDKERHSIEHLEEHAAQGPDIDHGGIVGGSKDELGGTVASRTNVGQVRLIGQYFGRSKITDHQPTVLDQQVMRLDVPVANPQRMNVKQTSECLVSEQFDLKSRHRLLRSLNV